MPQPTPWQAAAAARHTTIAPAHTANPSAPTADPSAQAASAPGTAGTFPQAAAAPPQTAEIPAPTVTPSPETAGSPASQATGTALRKSLMPPLAQNWPYLVAAAGSIAYFYMMFQPWMIVANWSGKATCDAFGTVTTTTTHLSLWSPYKAPGAKVSGVWAILASILVFVAVLAALETVRRGSRAAAAVTAAATLAISVLALIDMFYLGSKISEVQAGLSSDNDMGMQLGLVVSTLRGTGSYPWPGLAQKLGTSHLTSWAFAGPAVAFGSAVIALLRSWRTGLGGIAVAAARQVLVRS